MDGIVVSVELRDVDAPPRYAALCRLLAGGVAQMRAAGSVTQNNEGLAGSHPRPGPLTDATAKDAE